VSGFNYHLTDSFTASCIKSFSFVGLLIVNFISLFESVSDSGSFKLASEFFNLLFEEVNLLSRLVYLTCSFLNYLSRVYKVSVYSNKYYYYRSNKIIHNNRYRDIL
jgi:hypothetical protein